MSQILSPSLARCYGMTRVARVWKISRASVYRALKETLSRVRQSGACVRNPWRPAAYENQLIDVT